MPAYRYSRILDTIRDNELVTSRAIPKPTSHGGSTSPVKKSHPSSRGYITKSSNDEPGRIQIRLVSAEMARVHARATLKHGGSTTTIKAGVLAFDGEFISGNTSLVIFIQTYPQMCTLAGPPPAPLLTRFFLLQNALRRETARVFGWVSEDPMITDDDENDDQCDYEHDTGSACSCAVVLEIEQRGLLSNLHCRFVLDGERCSNQDCPYSHVKLKCAFSKKNHRRRPHVYLFLSSYGQHVHPTPLYHLWRISWYESSARSPFLHLLLLTILYRISLLEMYATRH